MRLIDADELKAKLQDYHDNYGEYNFCVGFDAEEYPKKGIEESIEFVDEAPTVDPVKHAHWFDTTTLIGNAKACSICKRSYIGDGISFVCKYCPTCGAKMDEVTHEAD